MLTLWGVMDLLKQLWGFLLDSDNRETVALIGGGAVTIIGGIVGAITWFIKRKKASEQNSTPSQSISIKGDAADTNQVQGNHNVTGDGNTNIVNMGDNAEALKAKDEFIADLKERLKTVESELKTASSEKDSNRDKVHILELELTELKSRLENPDKALAEAQAMIAELRKQLDRAGNVIDPATLKAARKALDDQDWLEAEKQWANIQIEAEQNMQAQQSLAAEAAFARGQIAEQAVNWPAAYTHYAHAADLDPKVQHLAHADMFAKRMGDYRKALCYGEACLNAIAETDGKTHLKYAAALNNQAVNFETTGRYDEAEPLYRQAIKIGKKTIGEDHPDYATWLNNLAGLLRETGRYDEAEPLYRQAIKIDKKTLGEDHHDYAIRVNNLAELLRSTGRYDEAEPLYRQAIKIGKKTIGENHPNYATHLNNLALLLVETRRYDEAESLYRQAIEIGKKTIGENHPNYATRLNNLAGLLRTTGRYDEAEPLYRQAIEIGKKTIGEEHPAYATWLNNLAGLLQVTGRYDEAEPLYQQAVRISETALGAEHPQTVMAKENYEIFKAERK